GVNMKNNQTQNPFAIFGTPNKVIVNGINEPDGEIADCLDALQKHASEVLSYIVTKIDGVVKLYVATV
ncbi:hypothetical protein, partial [Helicobacter rodentium]|uniref:hypothetical protein n=1 Tax=Helicobacter rodentium TaxID=59617 RepID=UPI002616725B